jgi:hypothetical protein
VITNLLRPFLLARLVSGAAVAILCAYALVIAWRVLARWRVGATSEGQLALERRAELVAAVVQGALAIAIVDLALTVLAADRLAPSIRGAMCAWGVLVANEWGFVALGASVVTAIACALWVVLHRLDLRLAKPVLTRRKFVSLFAIAPIVMIDLAVTVAWALELDMQVIASCCSVGLDEALGTRTADGGPRDAALYFGLATAIGAAISAVIVWRRPSRSTAIVAALASVVAAVAALPAIVWVVAPHAYETPHHLCPFCLLHADVLGIGWPLFAALLGAAICGSALFVVEAQRRASGEPVAIAAMEQRLARSAAVLWIAALCLAAAPIVRYAVVSGGASLFGGA